MKNDMIWSFMIRISDHMWEDGSKDTTSVWYTKCPKYVDTDPNEVDLETWDKVIKFLAEKKYNMLIVDIGDGIQFDSHPEISAPDAWSKEFLKKKLDEARALGLEVIPKLNFSTGHDTWLKEYRRMISTPIYYKVCADLIAETCELFDHPRFFHLGLDEETEAHQVRHEMAIIRGAKLYWHDSFFFFKEAEKNGARPWVWSDYYWHHPELFLQNMPKEVLQSNWFYGVFKDYAKTDNAYTYIQTYEDLDKAGYDQVPTGASYTQSINGIQTVAYAKDKLTPELLKGFMTCPWLSTKKEFEHLFMFDIDRMYQGRQKYYPETLED